MSKHYLSEMKRKNLNSVQATLKLLHEKDMPILLENLKLEYFEKRGISSSLMDRYLKELEEMGIVMVDYEANKVYWLKDSNKEQ